MSKPIELSREARQAAAAGLRKVLTEELDVEVGSLQAEIILDRLVLDLGPVLYNRALTDARAVIAEMRAFAPHWLAGCALRDISF